MLISRNILDWELVTELLIIDVCCFSDFRKCNNYRKWGQAFDLVVKMLCAITVFHIVVPDFKSGLHSDSSFLQMHVVGCSGWSRRMPVVRIGNSDCIPGSWLQPGTVLVVVYLGREPLNGSSSLFFLRPVCLSNRYI